MIAKAFLFLVLTVFSSLAQLRPDSTPKDTFVLIHGSNVGSWTFYKLKPLLEDQGHTVITFDLPAMGTDKTDPTQVTLQHHVNKTIQVLDSLSQPAIVVAHSYGGAILSEAAEARPDKVKVAVYLSAYMLKTGENVMATKQRNPVPLPADLITFQYTPTNIPITFTYNLDLIKDVLCTGCDEYDITLSKMMFVAQPAITWITPITIGDNFTSVNKVYISATQDNSVQPDLQKEMYSRFPETKVYKINSPHMVAFAQPNELANILTSFDKDKSSKLLLNSSVYLLIIVSFVFL